MPDKISLDRETFKALAGDTRITILKELSERRKTQTELAARLNISVPTANEHLGLLKKAGLVQEINEGRKWKYYSLTFKGKSIVNPEEVQIMVILSVATIGFLAMLYLIFGRFFVSMQSFGAENEATRAASPQVLTTAIPAAGKAAADAGTQGAQNLVPQAAQGAASLLPQFSMPELAILVIFALAVGLLAGCLVRKKI